MEISVSVYPLSYERILSSLKEGERGRERERERERDGFK